MCFLWGLSCLISHEKLTWHLSGYIWSYLTNSKHQNKNFHISGLVTMWFFNVEFLVSASKIFISTRLNRNSCLQTGRNILHSSFKLERKILIWYLVVLCANIKVFSCEKNRNKWWLIDEEKDGIERI
jgi:hypothetical protein